MLRKMESDKRSVRLFLQTVDNLMFDSAAENFSSFLRGYGSKLLQQRATEVFLQYVVELASLNEACDYNLGNKKAVEIAVKIRDLLKKERIFINGKVSLS